MRGEERKEKRRGEEREQKRGGKEREDKRSGEESEQTGREVTLKVYTRELLGSNSSQDTAFSHYFPQCLQENARYIHNASFQIQFIIHQHAISRSTEALWNILLL
jgi:hypothetical protein